nr:adenosylmethionine--8-amino-7-oxononanoate transaminase [Microlunatus speluncae]
MGGDLIERDRGLLWHPYAPLDGPAPYAVTRAEGVRLGLTGPDGRRHTAIDAMSSWWTAVHGYRNPVLDRAATEQVGRFSHVMFGGLTHEPAVRLAERLVRVAPAGLRHVFFADSGSVAVEVAIKLALQYQAAAGRPGRQRLAALRGAYHGDTAAAMSLGDPDSGMHAVFPRLLPEQVFLPQPPAAALVAGRIAGETDPAAVDRWIAEVELIIAEAADRLAAIMVEPVLQNAGGMHAYPPRCLAALRRIADDHDLLLITDEIATGFSRTGPLFAVDWAGIAPDVACVGKALTGGYLSLAAVLCHPRVAEAVTRSPQRALLHGPTFMANPLACSVADASLGLLESMPVRDLVEGIGAGFATALEPARALTCVRDVRALGAVGVIELTGPVDVPAVTRAALDLGVWLRPFRNLVYAMPPYVTEADDVARIGAAMVAAVDRVHGR